MRITLLLLLMLTGCSAEYKRGYRDGRETGQLEGEIKVYNEQITRWNQKTKALSE